MRSKVERQSEEAEKAVRDICRATRRQYSAEEKVRIVIAGLRGEDSVARLLGKQGKRDEARTMLTEIYNWFTEGFDTPRPERRQGAAP